MKTSYRKGTLVASALVLGLIATQSANAQIRSTKHDFSGGVNSNPANAIHVKAGDNNDEICVYCHTPHGANMNVTAPLWNKNIPGTSYTTYSSGTMQADTTNTELNTVSNKHMSLACLSCHDGTQAMDNMINAPGGDGYSTNGGGANGTNLDWSTSITYSPGSTGATEVNAAGMMLGNGSNGSTMGLGQSANGGTVAMLSADLSNDHPIAMAYCGGSVVAGAGGSANCRDTYFNDASTTTDSMGNTMWYVPATGALALGTAAAAGLRLYGNVTAASGNTANTNPTVECGSCHDPHTSTATFLRISNAGSAVCLTCHAK